mmetsp:Transcript_28156/g.43376  ORF Transcript_28156/g.43376 Transcript_28156/m.43376 type:complete len:586 (-) Transcript_28156:115-1872(-)|eukprot:CAMPEP_0117029408 /NCGR_PEP_ID=MMETSP0472-20121206/21295_1 /TAXON_ID=693140 ORGANISM="Tiarina fusus, Strain LIS" /NCGR_SAMPLE_ID=MMETSP0472 /ASSEMBLY_ACC=CAM_ASM_000603 /LENGTH=585 /DNA_ID=CAMNT_0004737161 /DNA_START=126 /DNA_END=1883 /DNA_ORIENTATION=+
MKLSYDKETVEILLFAGSAVVFSLFTPSKSTQNAARTNTRGRGVVTTKSSIKRYSLADSVSMSRLSVVDILSGRHSVQDVVYHMSMDLFFTAIMKLFDANVKKTKWYKAHEIPVPYKDPRRDNLNMMDFFAGKLHTLNNDEFVKIPLTVWYGILVMNKLPFDDRLTEYMSLEEGKEDLKRMFPTIDTPPEGWWEEPTSDKSLKRYFFSGMPMCMVQRCKNSSDPDEYYVVDCAFMDKYKVREGYEPLGCKGYFDGQGNVTKITDVDINDPSNVTTYRPGGEWWKYAKLKLRTAAFVFASTIHLVESHYVWGAIPATALRLYLPANHKVRRAMSCHFFKTIYTVVRSKVSLFHRRGLLLRGTSLAYEGGLEAVVQESFELFEFQTFPGMLKKNGVTDCDFLVLNHDGMDVYKIIVDYVSEVFDGIYENQAALEKDEPLRKVMQHITGYFNGAPKEYTLENVKMIWGEIIFQVTALHNLVGDATWCSLDPSIINARLQQKELETGIASKEGAYAVAAITATTSVPCPVIKENWSHLFSKQDTTSKEALSRMHSKFQDLDKIIDERNKKREFNAVVFASKYITLSVAA